MTSEVGLSNNRGRRISQTGITRSAHVPVPGVRSVGSGAYIRQIDADHSKNYETIARQSGFDVQNFS